MSDFIIEDIAVETAPNPYNGHVAALVEAGEGKALTIIVTRGTKRDGTPSDGGKDKLLFQQAANAAGYTARVVKETEQEDATQIGLSFKLTPKNKRAGKPRAAAETAPAVEVETAPEAEAEVAPEVETEVETAPEAEVEAESRFGRRGNRR